MRTLRTLAFLLLAGAAALSSGCGSTSSTAGSTVTAAEIKSSMASVNTTIQATSNSSAAIALSSTALAGILAPGVPQLGAALKYPFDAREVAATMRPRAHKANSSATLITGSYRVVDSASAPIRYSDVPRNGVFLIGASTSPNAVAGDSDSVRVSNIQYYVDPISRDSTLDSLVIDAYVPHPIAPQTGPRVAHVTIGDSYVLGVPVAFRLSVLFDQLVEFNVDVSADILAGVYGTHFDVTNLEQGGATLSVTLGVQAAGDPQSSSFTLTGLQFQESHTAGTPTATWTTTMNFTHIYLAQDTSLAYLDSATVTGTVQKNGSTVATIAGTLKAPFNCDEVMVTVLSDKSQLTICDLYPVIPASGPIANLLEGQRRLVRGSFTTLRR